MRTTRNKKRQTRLSKLRASKPFQILVFVLLFGAVGVYLLLVSYAESPELANTYGPRVEIGWGVNAAGTENIPIGTTISPSVEYIAGGSHQQLPQPTAIVSSTYSALKYVRLTGIDCDPNVRCVSVTWPNFDNDPPPGTFMANDFGGTSSPSSMDDFAFDHKFSVCTDVPSIAPSPSQSYVPLYTPHFVVTGNDKRFVIATLIRYYISGNCDTNGGQSDQWYKTTRETQWYKCYNGNGTFDGPFYDGSRNSCFDPGNSLPGGNDTVQITGGKASTTGGQGSGKSPDPGAGGGGGGSSATSQSSQPNTIPSTSNQGDDKKQPKIEPSPFFDGRVFAAGSEADIQNPNTISIAGHKFSYGWLYLLGLPIVLGIAGWFGWRWWQKNMPRKKP